MNENFLILLAGRGCRNGAAIVESPKKDFPFVIHPIAVTEIIAFVLK